MDKIDFSIIEDNSKTTTPQNPQSTVATKGRKTSTKAVNSTEIDSNSKKIPEQEEKKNTVWADSRINLDKMGLNFDISENKIPQKVESEKTVKAPVSFEANLIDFSQKGNVQDSKKYTSRPMKVYSNNSESTTAGNNKDRMSDTMSIQELEDKTLVDLRSIGLKLNIHQAETFRKNELIMRIVEEQVKLGGNIFASGYLEIINDGAHGILRSKTFLVNESDVYVSSSQIKKFNLRKGDFVSGQARPAKEGERYLSLLKVEAINGLDPEKSILRPIFERLTPIYPNEQIILEMGQQPFANRIIDMISPIGKGQRGMISAPPKSGKTVLLKDLALGIRKNSPEIHLMIVLIGERPEEVTDIERNVPGAEVFASNFDESPIDQTKVAEMSLEHAKRLVEKGLDVVILMDSITRLARAYNVALPTSGRTLSGGMDPAALYPAKRFFGAARNFEIGGSLTIIATALVETGSRMDDVVFEEFKGTGNMELKLDRDLAESRIFPAIDIFSSGTRNEELLLGNNRLEQAQRLGRMLRLLRDNKGEPMAVLIDRLRKTKDNNEFLDKLMEG